MMESLTNEIYEKGLKVINEVGRKVHYTRQSSQRTRRTLTLKEEKSEPSC